MKEIKMYTTNVGLKGELKTFLIVISFPEADGIVEITCIINL